MNTKTKYAVIDTETSGLFDFGKPADAPGQPRLAALAIITLDENLKVEQEISFLVRPDGWEMGAEAGAINGLTTEMLTLHGKPVLAALASYAALVDAGYVVAAFNAQFDTKMLRGEMRRAGMDDRFERTPNICLMRASTDLCKLPTIRCRGGFKFPKLSEACAFFGLTQPASHSALGDARSAVAILWALVQLEKLPAPEVHYAKTPPVSVAPAEVATPGRPVFAAERRPTWSADLQPLPPIRPTPKGELLTIAGLEGVSIASTDEARTARDEMLLVTARVGTVSDAASAEFAGLVLRDVTALTRSVEDARKVVKAPILDQGRQVDALAWELTGKLDAEEKRIGSLLGVWNREQNRLAEVARQKAIDEERKIRDEANRKQREADDKARPAQVELARKANAARTATKAAEYRAAADKRALAAAQEQERRDLATEQAIVETRVSAAAAVPAKPAGISTREEVRFEVLDLVALYEAAPFLVVLTPNTAAIKAAVKGLTGAQTLPGVRHWREAVSVVR